MSRFSILLLFYSFLTVGSLLSNNVTTWTTADVMEWASSEAAGFSDPSAARGVIEQHAVTGSVLLSVDPNDLKEEFGISSGLERKKVMVAINNLKDSGFVGRSFWEYRSMDRRAIFKINGLLPVAPRWALSLLESEWPEHARPSKGISTLEWLLAPELYIFRNYDTILGCLPSGLASCLVCAFLSSSFFLSNSFVTHITFSFCGAVLCCPSIYV